MRSIWLAAVLLVAGLAILLLRPMFLADEAGVGVYSAGAGLLTWVGWLLAIVGGLLTALSLFRSRRKDRS